MEKVFQEKLKEGHLKGTHQRLVVLKVLSGTKSHPDVQWVYKEVKKTVPTISLATVYSALRTLRNKDIVQEIGAYGDMRRFDGNSSHHPHILCLGCGKIEDLEGLDIEFSNLSRKVSKDTKYKLLDRDVSFHGYCPKCQGKGNKND